MPQTQATPRHLLITGILSLLWNAMGAMDYVMTQTKNEEYMSQYTPEQLGFVYGFPAWVDGAWAIAAWGAVAGSLLLLLKKGAAVPVFLTSFIAMVATTIYHFGLSDGMEFFGDWFSLAFSAVIYLAAFALWRYAHAMRDRGILG